MSIVLTYFDRETSVDNSIPCVHTVTDTRYSHDVIQGWWLYQL